MALSLELSGILWWHFAYTLVYWQDVAHEIVKWHLGLVEVSPRFKFWKKWKLTIKPFGIFWSNFADNLMLKRSNPRNCKMIFIIGQDFAEFQILKKWNWPCPLNLLVYFDKILHTHYYWHNLDRGIAKSSPRDCKMTFNIGRGFAERQILKKWKWPYLLNWVEYFDNLLRKHWYWQDIAKEIARWHFLSVEALPSSKFWKSENGPICRTVKNIVMKFCIHIDTDNM